MEKNLNRYRFTVAHEIGHLILHEDFIRSRYPDDTEDWKNRVIAISDADNSRMEFQARSFAAQVLVPRPELVLALEDAKDYATGKGMDLGELKEFGEEWVAAWIAKQFKVSTEVILRRFAAENVF